MASASSLAFARNTSVADMRDSEIGSNHRTLAHWLEHIQHQHPHTIAMGLDRVREVAQRMRLPRCAKHVIAVAGTNGKGSTVAFIDAIARAAGLRVGAYTSPHLLRYNERVRINGAHAEDAALVAAFKTVEAARGDTPLTYFEYGTLAALQLFAQSGLDLAVLEVGLGGRLDAVNLVDADAAIVTTVDLDHQQWLGEDRESIGREKAGIARAFKPLILGDDDPPASVLRHAYAIGANALRIGCDFFAERLDDARWRWRDAGVAYDLPLPQLAAPAQLRNAACAIAALRSLPLPIHAVDYAQGVSQARLAGRLQHVRHAGIDLYFDVGHNPQAARALAQWLRGEPQQARTIAVYAALCDKDSAGVAMALADQIDAWLLAGVCEAGPRAQTADALRQRLPPVIAAGAQAFACVADALAAALAEASTGDRVLVFGSFHAVAEAMRALDVR